MTRTVLSAPKDFWQYTCTECTANVHAFRWHKLQLQRQYKSSGSRHEIKTIQVTRSRLEWKNQAHPASVPRSRRTKACPTLTVIFLRSYRSWALRSREVYEKFSYSSKCGSLERSMLVRTSPFLTLKYILLMSYTTKI